MTLSMIPMEKLYKSICRWCGRQGKTAYSSLGRIPNQTPFVEGTCQCHPSGRTNMPHTPRWEEAGEFTGAEVLYRSICQWCGKQGKAAYSEHGRIPNQTPSVPGKCQCHPSGMPDMPHSPHWEK